MFLIFLRLNLSQDYRELSQNIKNYPQLLPDISQIGPGKKTFVMGGHEILEIFEHAEDFFLFLAATKTIRFLAQEHAQHSGSSPKTWPGTPRTYAN